MARTDENAIVQTGEMTTGTDEKMVVESPGMVVVKNEMIIETTAEADEKEET